MGRRMACVEGANAASAAEARYRATASATVPGALRLAPMTTGAASDIAAAYASMNSVDQGIPGKGASLRPGRRR